MRAGFKKATTSAGLDRHQKCNVRQNKKQEAKCIFSAYTAEDAV
jgi:hypothetical protein